MKVSGVCGAANLYRQSAMSFNLYFQTLLCATLSQADTMTAQQVQATPSSNSIYILCVCIHQITNVNQDKPTNRYELVLG